MLKKNVEHDHLQAEMTTHKATTLESAQHMPTTQQASTIQQTSTVPATATAQPIPMLDLQAEVASLWDEIHTAMNRVLRSSQFVLGTEVAAFEQDVAAYLNIPHAIAVNSGTDALMIALDALGIGPGDEVITTSFSFFATAEAISRVGAVPVFVDIDPTTFNLDPQHLEQALTDRTKAIVPVHLFGLPAALTEIMAFANTHQLAVVEDAAQAFGATYEKKKIGTVGTVGTFSFYPTKNLGAYGDGGLLVTADADVAARARLLRNHGSKRAYHNEILGYNSRLDGLQAAILRVKLPYVEEWNALRQMRASIYEQLFTTHTGNHMGNVDDTPPESQEAPLLGLPTSNIPKGSGHVFHQYTLRIATPTLRQKVTDALTQHQIAHKIFYEKPIHTLPVYQHQALRHPLAHTEWAAKTVLSVPFWPHMDDAVQTRVVEVIGQVLTKASVKASARASEKLNKMDKPDKEVAGVENILGDVL